jgi:hypothetical protein
MLNWADCTDDHSNTEWIAPSPYGDDGSAFYWRLSQKLENDQILWYENHDEDIMDDNPCDFTTLEEAKLFIEEQHNAIISAEEPHV